jgi:hypothetical protein
MNELNSLLLEGWKIKNETPTTYELQKNNSKIGFHILILFLLQQNINSKILNGYITKYGFKWDLSLIKNAWLVAIMLCYL